MAKPRKNRRPPKVRDVLAVARKCIAEGRYRDTRHATDRRSERSITTLEVLQIIKRGRHTPRRDRYDALYGGSGWSYCIEGKTVDNRHLRVIIAFDEETQTLIVSAIDLDQSGA